MNFSDADFQANMAFARKQTAHVEAEVYKQKYPELNYAELIPVDYSADAWAKSITYYSMDSAGKADWVNSNGTDIPLVGTAMREHESAVYTAGIGYDYGYGEINNARRLGIDLTGDKAAAARRAYEQMVYGIALEGDAKKNFEGLYNYTGVPQTAAATTGAGSTSTWSTKTPDQIVEDVSNILIGVHTATKTTEIADTLILPIERLQKISAQRMTDGNMSVLDYIRKSNVYTAETGSPLTIRGKRGLLTKGAGGTARMVAYRRGPDVMKLHIPMEHQFIGEAQQNVLYFKRPGIFRLGGLDIRLKKVVSYVDGI